MKDKIVFLDRDGTINVDYGYVYQIEKLDFEVGVIEGLSKLNDLGFKFIIITNQSGISRGYYTEQDFQIFMDEMQRRLLESGINISAVYHCPHQDEDECDCRKPKIGMFEKAEKDFDIDWENSFAVGDNERDLSICGYKPITGILISKTNKGKFINFDTFLDATNYIESYINK